MAGPTRASAKKMTRAEVPVAIPPQSSSGSTVFDENMNGEAYTLPQRPTPSQTDVSDVQYDRSKSCQSLTKIWLLANSLRS